MRGAYLGLTSLTIDGSLSALNLPVEIGALVQSVRAGHGRGQGRHPRRHRSARPPKTAQVAVGGDIIVKLDGKEVAELRRPGERHRGQRSRATTVTIELLRATATAATNTRR